MSQPPQITEEEWEGHKDAIISLFLGSVEGEIQGEGQTLNSLAHSMRETYGFTASVSQFEARLKIWEARKNLKPEEWKPVFEWLDMLPKAAKSRVVISGRVAPRTKISRARKYYKDKSRNAGHAGPPALGPSISPSSHSKQIRIEIQDSGGRWVQLSETNTTFELGNCSPSRAEIPEETNTQLYTSDPTPAIPNELSVSARNSRHLLDFDISRLGSFQDSGPSVPILMGHPSAWLQQLPSKRLLEKLVGINYNQNVSQIQDRSKRKITGLNETMSHFGLGGPGPGTLDIRFSSQGFQCHNGRNQSIMARDDYSRIKFTQCLFMAIMNGVHDLGDITGEALDGCLGPDGTLSSSLLSCFQAAPKYIAKTLASSLFQASICSNKQAVVAQLLEEGLSHANDSMVVDRSGALSTPLELAASLGDEGLLDLLLFHKADPNKTYHPKGAGALLVLIEHDPSLAILGKLFAAGAKVPPNIMLKIDKLENEALSLITLHILPSQHTDFFRAGFWSRFISKWGDITGATIVNKFLYDCVEHHSGRCISQFQEMIEWSLVSAAKNGHAETFLAIFPHCTLSSNTRLLSASIMGKHPTIIDFVMSRRPNINPRPHALDRRGFIVLEREHVTTPLAASITARNTDFINILARADVFNSLHEGGRFEVAIDAAVEIGDYELVARLLDSCPSLESHSLARALHTAISSGYEDIALMLLERGASVYTGKLGGSHHSSLLLVAIDKGNLDIAQSLLTLGDIGHRSTEHLSTHLMCLTDPLITDNHLSSFQGKFRYRVNTHMTPNDFEPSPNLECFYPESDNRRHVSRYLLPALKDKRMCDLILGSKLATVQFLTVCLAAAVSQNDPDLAQKLIEKGANAADNVVLTCATRWGPDLVPLLIDGTNRRRNVVTKGLRTNVLKEAIRQGPKRADLVSLFIKSEYVDIFDTGDCDSFNGLVYYNKQEVLTPLGEAIRAATAFPQFSYDTAKLLLDHGVDADGIVNFDTRAQLPTNKTAIIEAVSVGNQELVELLIEYGAHVNLALRHMVRRTPLQMAAERGDLEMTKLLIRHGADVNAEPHIAMGGIALQFAAISGNCDLAAELLQHGALLHKPPPKIGGRWPIEGAAENGRLDMVQFLWTANQETLFIHDGENGFQERNFKKAMRLAVENRKFACRDLIAELTGLPIDSTDLPPVVSPMYVDWPPPGRSVD
ncbi:hypothetical protein E0Z10_g758 [Xylaria hypoxylon]|uniref:Clr5 domain-containing protein n=1 Tax=Xylaria hypoxylon TaxID=37992 RepID=A0A4Z0Z6Y0_9PEZI|nr:hypothetical protein E0Z10_g758 [Xylaria hypoxylon]